MCEHLLEIRHVDLAQLDLHVLGDVFQRAIRAFECRVSLLLPILFSARNDPRETLELLVVGFFYQFLLPLSVHTLALVLVQRQVEEPVEPSVNVFDVSIDP